MDAKILERRVVYDRWSTISDNRVQLPNGAIEQRVIEDHGDAAAVLLYDPDRRVALLVRQPRAPVLLEAAPPLIEVVAGRMDGDDDAETARREALEEAGVTIRTLERVATVWTMPAVSTERITLFLAAYTHADRTGAGGGAEDENECIELVEMPLAELWRMVSGGDAVDGKTLILAQALRIRRPELFD